DALRRRWTRECRAAVRLLSGRALRASGRSGKPRSKLLPVVMRRLIIALLVVANVTAACGGPPPKAPRLPPPVEGSSLGDGDVIEVLVYDEPSMSKTYKVAPNGTIDFPFAGTVEVEGKEPQEIADILRARL